MKGRLFVKYNLLDIIKLILFPTSKTWNNILDKKQVFYCSACGKETAYNDTPIINDDLWKKVVKYHNLEKIEEISNSRKGYGIIEPKRRYFDWIVRHIKRLNEKKFGCFVCKDCMEKALGRKLKPEDLKDCTINRKILKTYRKYDTEER